MVSTGDSDLHCLACVDPNQRSDEDCGRIFAHLRCIPDLWQLREPAQRDLAKRVRCQHYEANDILYKAGASCECWFIVLTGSVLIDGAMFLPKSCFGRRIPNSVVRHNECLILESTDLLVFDYPSEGSDMQHSGLVDSGLSVRQSACSSRSSVNSIAWIKRQTRSSHASDTSSAYSGSDMMTGDLLDMSALSSCLPDSDDEMDIPGHGGEILYHDSIKEALSKPPEDRTEDDMEAIVDAVQHLSAFSPMTQSTRRILCSVARLICVPEVDTVLLEDGEVLEGWCVLIQGVVEVILSQTAPRTKVNVGEAFGVAPSREIQRHRGRLITATADCRFLRVSRSDYSRALELEVVNTTSVVEGGQTVMVKEFRSLDAGARKGEILIKGTPEKLLDHLIEEQSVVDPSYVEDFLLCYRVFLSSPRSVIDQLLKWLCSGKGSASAVQRVRERVALVVTKWANGHMEDFEGSQEMVDFVERVSDAMKNLGMTVQLERLYRACSCASKPRTVVLRRSDRSDPFHFSLLGGKDHSTGIFISKVTAGSKAAQAGLRVGDQLLEVNARCCLDLKHALVVELLNRALHVVISVRSNLNGYHRLQNASKTPPASPRSLRPQRSLPGDAPPATSPLERTDGERASLPTTSLKRLMLKRKGASFSLFNRLTTTSRMSESSKEKSSRSRSANNSPSRSSSGPSRTLAGSSGDLPSATSDLQNGPDHTGMPDAVVRVFHKDSESGTTSSVFLFVHRSTRVCEVVMLALVEFQFAYSRSSDYLLCEVSVEPGPLVKQKVLKDDAVDLPSSMKVNARYYLKSRHVTSSMVEESDIAEMVGETRGGMLELPVQEVAIQLFVDAYGQLCQVPARDMVHSVLTKMETVALDRYAKLSNLWRCWVVTEVVNEVGSASRRAKLIKRFIRLAALSREVGNLEAFFSILSGLDAGPVSRLKTSWEKVPNREMKLLKSLTQLLDLTGNMRTLRQLHRGQPPLVPMAVIVLKDLAAIHENQDTWTSEGMVNFEKLRVIARRVRAFTSLAGETENAATSDPKAFALLVAHERLRAVNRNSGGVSVVAYSGGGSLGPSSGEWWKQSAVSLVQTVNHAASAATATLKRQNANAGTNSQACNSAPTRRRSTVLNPRRMWEEQRVARRVVYYLDNLHVEMDDLKLMRLSQLCEGASLSVAHQHSLSADQTPGSLNKHRRNCSLDALTGCRVGQVMSEDARKLASLAAEAALTKGPGPTPPPVPSRASKPLLATMSMDGGDMLCRKPSSICSADSGLVSMSSGESARNSGHSSTVSVTVQGEGGNVLTDRQEMVPTPLVFVPPNRHPPPYNLAISLKQQQAQTAGIQEGGSSVKRSSSESRSHLHAVRRHPPRKHSSPVGPQKDDDAYHRRDDHVTTV